jgi:flagellin-like protein
MNNNLKQNNEAVSPVIGVILMVAITVVLAATVYLLVNGLTSDLDTSTPAQISMARNAGGDYLVQMIGNDDIAWEYVNVNGCEDIIDADNDGLISAGDYISNCEEQITMIYNNQVIWSHD